MKRDVKITVAGLTGSGKSRILYIVKKALKAEGFNINFKGTTDYDNEEKFDNAMEKNFHEAVKSIQLRTDIEIEQIQLRRDFTNNAIEIL